MIDINDCVTRIINYYNDRPSLGVLGVQGQTVISETADPYKNTMSVFIQKPVAMGTSTYFTQEVDSVLTAFQRWHYTVSVRTVFTGKQCLQNASLHYQRIIDYFKQFTDLSLLANTAFINTGMVFDKTRYLNRFQSDSRYLAFLEIPVESAFMNSFEEDLNAYAEPGPESLLTTRHIEGSIDG